MALVSAAARASSLGSRCARLSAARGLASATAASDSERERDAVAADVAAATERARAAREAPSADVPTAAGLPETAGRRALVRPVMPMRSGEPVIARGPAWRVTAAGECDDVNRFRSPLMGWTASAVAEAAMQPDALQFDSATAAVEFAQRQGWRPEVEPPPSLPQFNVASIPGAAKGKPVPYERNFSVARGGIPQWPPAGADDTEAPLYDVDLDADTPRG